MPISLVSDSTTPRGSKRGPSTLCVPRNQAHMNGNGGPIGAEGGSGATKAGTPKAAGGSLPNKGLDGSLSWSPSSAPTTPSGKGDGMSGLPFAQVGLPSPLWLLFSAAWWACCNNNSTCRLYVGSKGQRLLTGESWGGECR